jgi:hypothetical protein
VSTCIKFGHNETLASVRQVIAFLLFFWSEKEILQDMRLFNTLWSRIQKSDTEDDERDLDDTCTDKTIDNTHRKHTWQDTWRRLVDCV